MSTFAVYLAPDEFIANSSANVDPLSYVGLLTTLSTTAPAGSTSLSLSSATGAPTGSAQFWILDGYTSEKVTGTITSTTLALSSPTLAAHSAGASISSAGIGGCLAQLIVDASRHVDTICRQGPKGVLERTLYAVSRTERYSLQTSRATVDSDGTLTMWPWHFPVQSLASIQLQAGAAPASAIDLSSMVLPEGARDIGIPFAGFSGSTYTGIWATSTSFRQENVWVALTYTGGPLTSMAVGDVSDDIKRACVYLVMHILGYRVNSTGAMSVSQGDINRRFGIKGGNKSLLVLDAEDLLTPYTHLHR